MLLTSPLTVLLHLESKCHNSVCEMYPMIRFLSGTPIHGPQQMAHTSFCMQIYSLGMFTDIVITWTSIVK